MCIFFNFDYLRITLQSSDLIWGIKFRAPSPSTHLLLPSSSYPWLPMVVSLFLTHLLLEVASLITFPPSPFRCHWSSRSKRLHWWRRSKAYKLYMELHQFLTQSITGCYNKHSKIQEKVAKLLRIKYSLNKMPLN